MAKCDISIELDEPDRTYTGGDRIRGTVQVMIDADVKCKGLEISSGWRTHGRGNVASGIAETVTAFSGDWSAGQKESYRFELDVAGWPPSYHGSYINIDHYIDVRAKIPWAFDPKASAEFLMRPVTGPDAADLSTSTQLNGCVGTAFGVVFLGMLLIGVGVFATVLIANPIVGLAMGAVFFPIIGLIAARKLLPKYLLGDVEAELMTPHVAPGGRVQARLAFQPRRSFKLNSISAELNGAEVCVSGSGSNRKTHRNAFFSDRHELEGATTLEAGDRKEFDLDLPIPNDVPYSFDLSDNNLNWTIDLRVDIPRWPDWAKSLKLAVVPDGRLAEAYLESTQASHQPSDRDVAGGGDSPLEITFEETASHLWQFRDDADQVDLLVEAVLGMTFEIDAFVERRLLYSGDEDPHPYKDGYAVWGHHSEPPLPLVLYIPHELADEFEQAGNELWRCRGTIVGWDHQHRRLQIKVLVR